MNTADSIDVIILSGGQGSRLKPVVPDRQKTVAPVNGRPFLSLLLRQLAHLPVGKLIVCTGHLAPSVKTAIGNCATAFPVEFSHEETPLGTGGAARYALPLVESPEILVMNGDSFADCDLKTFCETGRAAHRPAQMLLAAVDDVSRFGRIELNEQHRVTSFAEKGANGTGLINAGVYLFKSSVIERIPVNTPYSLEKQLFPELVAKCELYGYPCCGRFIDIGTPESYAAAEKFFEQKYEH